MKRLLILLLILMFVFSIIGCKKNPGNTSSGVPTTSGIIYATDPDNANDDNDKNTAGNDSNTNSDADNTSGKNNSDGSLTNDNTASPGTSGTASNPNGAGISSGNSSGADNSHSSNGAGLTGNTSNTNSSNNSSNTSGNTSGNGSNNTSGNISDNNSGTDKPQNPTNSDSSGTSSGSKEYDNIACRTVADNDWKTVELVSKSNKLYISANIPSDWEIRDDGSIYRNGAKIGSISTKAQGNAVNVFEQNSKTVGTIVFKKSVEKYVSNGVNEYKRIFKASEALVTGANNLHLSVNYSELDDNATTKIFNSLAYCGVDRKIPEIKNDSMKFLILGNSFITTSKVGEFLSDMLITDGAKYVVETKSLPNAEVADFANDSQLIESIGKGEYAYIFQCGFYSDDKSWGSAQSDGPLKTIIDACAKSNTGLVIFPAYNESSSVINRALEKYTNIYCINWKNEINNLINSGIGESSPSSLTEADFCQNDSYKHSTPLAGYVGAHMIYRNIFGKMPPSLSATAPLTMSEINNKLISYPSTGIVPGKTAIYKYYI